MKSRFYYSPPFREGSKGRVNFKQLAPSLFLPLKGEEIQGKYQLASRDDRFPLSALQHH